MSEPMQQAASVTVTGKSFGWIAEHAFPNGSVLRCLPCKKQRNCTTSEIAEYMERGFPKCRVCSHRVELVNVWVEK